MSAKRLTRAELDRMDGGDDYPMGRLRAYRLANIRRLIAHVRAQDEALREIWANADDGEAICRMCEKNSQVASAAWLEDK